MNALSKIKSAGFNVSLHESGGVCITPASELTQQQREFIKTHKPEIISLLKVKGEKKLSIHQTVALLETACRGTGLEPEQFWSFLDESDVEDIRNNLIPLETLVAYARSWSRYPDLVPICNPAPYKGVLDER